MATLGSGLAAKAEDSMRYRKAYNAEVEAMMAEGKTPPDFDVWLESYKKESEKSMNDGFESVRKRKTK